MALSSTNSQIRNLVLLIAFAVGSAFLLSMFLILSYGPSGKYLVKNALLEPNLVSTLSYNDTNFRTNSLTRYVYDGIEISYFDTDENQIKTLKIDPSQYKKIYDIIMNDVSLAEVNNDILDSFMVKEAFSALAIKVRTESHADWIDETKDFQSVNFSQNYYRIRLHEEKNPNIWVYFHHRNIHQILLDQIENIQNMTKDASNAKSN